MESFDMCSKYFVEYVKYQKVLYSPIKTAGFIPERGSEVFVRNIPFRENEDELLMFFEIVGEIYQLRLMMKENGYENRGFAYVTYLNPASAKRAVRELNEKLFKGLYVLKIEPSLNNCRLFIGGVPTYKSKDEVWQELVKNGIRHIVDVIMYRSYSDRAKNRGFVFVEFRTHEEAAYYRAKFAKNFRLWNCSVIVDWSVPIPEVDECIMESVKILYMRNLNVLETPIEFQKIILQYVDAEDLEKIFKFKNYAFIHLHHRTCAEELMANLKKYYKDTDVEITWAKPPNKYTTQEFRQKKVSSLGLPVSSTSMSSSSTSSTNSLSPPTTFVKSKPQSIFQIAGDYQLPVINEPKSKGMLLPPAITLNCQTTDAHLGPILATGKSPSEVDAFKAMLSQGCNSGYIETPPRFSHVFEPDTRHLMSRTFTYGNSYYSNPINIPVRYDPCRQTNSLPSNVSHPRGMYSADILERQISRSFSMDYVPIAHRMARPVSIFFPPWQNRKEPYDPITQFQSRMSQLLGNDSGSEGISFENSSDFASDSSLPRNYSMEELEEIIGDIID